MATWQEREAQMLATLALGPEGTPAARVLLLDAPFRSDSGQQMLAFALASVAVTAWRTDLKWLDRLAAKVKKTWPATWSRDWFLQSIGSTQALVKRLTGGADRRAPPAKDLPDKPHPRWLARAATQDFSELDALLGAITEGPTTQIAERAQALLGWPKDARIARAGLALHEGRLVSNVRHPIWAAAGNLMAVHADAALRRELQSKMVEDPALASWHWISHWQGGAEPVERKEAPAPTGGAPKNPEDWLAWVLAAPTDVTRRALWADWLLERGDPRGELLSLQLLDRPLTPKEEKRVGALLKKHARVWLGKLSAVLDPKTAVFERGLAIGGRVNRVAEGRVFPEDAGWAVIERLTVPGYRVGPKLEAALLACVPRLTALDGPTLPFLRKVLGLRADRLEQLAIDFGFHAGGIASGDLALLTAAQFPALRRLRVSGQPGNPVLKALTGLPWFGQLDRLCVDGGLLADRLIAVQATSLPRLDVLAANSLSWEPTEAGFSYRATRAPGAKWKLEAIAMPERHRTVPPDYFYEHDLLHNLTMLRASFVEISLVAPKGFQPSPKVGKAVAAQIARLVR